MPQVENSKIKRIVSTYFQYDGNPLQSAKNSRGVKVSPPFLVEGGRCIKLESKGIMDQLKKHWDVLILNEGESPGLPKDCLNLGEGYEILWLCHAGATEKQEATLKKFLGVDGARLIIRTFNHGPDAYSQYLDKVESLWTPEHADYAAKLAELDRALRAEQLESDICDALWLLAALNLVDDRAERWAIYTKIGKIVANIKKCLVGDLDRELVATKWHEINPDNLKAEPYTHFKEALRYVLEMHNQI